MTSLFSLLMAVLVIGVLIPANGPGDSRPEVPDKIKVPEGEHLVLKAQASGSQVYVCRQGTDGKFAWTLKAPEAELRDERGQVIGRHFAGPTWRHNDGSEVMGKAVGRVDSPDPGSIPWLLITAAGHSGDGILSRVSTIQRTHTKGGQPPPANECGSAKENTEVKIAYTADYYFFAPAK